MSWQRDTEMFKMESRAAEIYKHVDAIRHGEDGSLAVASSSLTGRSWAGSIWLFKDPTKAPDVSYCSSGSTTKTGTTDIGWVDSRRLCLASDSGAIELWCMSGVCQTLEHMVSYVEHDNTIASLSVAGDGNTVASASWDKTVKVWDLQREKCCCSYRGHSDMLWSVKFSRTDKDIFITAAQDGDIILWDRRKDRPATRVCTGNSKLIPHSLDWGALDSQVFAAGYEDGQVHLYNMKNCREVLYSYIPHDRTVNRVAFSPRSPEWLASISDDGWTHVHDIVNSATVLRNNDHSDFVRGLSWSPADDSLCTSGWDGNLFSYRLGKVSQSSDLAVELDKSQATSVSMDTDGIPQLVVNGNANGIHSSDSALNDENMEVDQSAEVQNSLKMPKSCDESYSDLVKEEQIDTVSITKTKETSSELLCNSKSEKSETTNTGSKVNEI